MNNRGLSPIYSHDFANNAASAYYSSQGAIVQTNVTLTTSDGLGGTVPPAIADQVLNGNPNDVYQIPPGATATDLSGNSLLSFQLNNQGQAIIEIKTGDAVLSPNQSIVYPAAQAGNAVGVGGNAALASVQGPIPSIPVIIIRYP
jgi:filamentous hemagglutinin